VICTLCRESAIGVFVLTSGRLSAPVVPSNVIVLPPIPSPPLYASANLPVTVTSLPYCTFLIVLSVRTVWIGSLAVGGAFTLSR
jgi:hypothetical protein